MGVPSFDCDNGHRVEGDLCPPSDVLGEQPTLCLDVPGTLIRPLAAPSGSLEPDEKRVRPQLKTEVIGSCHSPSIGSMLIETCVVEEVSDTCSDGSPSLCRV